MDSSRVSCCFLGSERRLGKPVQREVVGDWGTMQGFTQR